MIEYKTGESGQVVNGRTYYLSLIGKEVIVYTNNTYQKHDVLECPCPRCNSGIYPDDIMEIIRDAKV